jgi:phage-related protein
LKHILALCRVIDLEPLEFAQIALKPRPGQRGPLLRRLEALLPNARAEACATDQKLEAGLWEVRSHLAQGIARIIFTVAKDTMVLLHGFVKKSQKIPPTDLRIARQRLAALRKE